MSTGVLGKVGINFCLKFFVIKNFTYLIIQWHYKHSAYFDQILHVVFMLRRTRGPTVDPVISITTGGQLEAVPHHKGRGTEIKAIKVTTLVHKLFQSFLSIVHHVIIQLNAVVYTIWTCKQNAIVFNNFKL